MKTSEHSGSLLTLFGSNPRTYQKGSTAASGPGHSECAWLCCSPISPSAQAYVTRTLCFVGTEGSTRADFWSRELQTSRKTHRHLLEGPRKTGLLRWHLLHLFIILMPSSALPDRVYSGFPEDLGLAKLLGLEEEASARHPSRYIILPIHHFGLANRLRLLASGVIFAQETGR